MSVSNYDYKRRGIALRKRDALRDAMQHAQVCANAQLDDARLQDEADAAAELFLRNEEKIEYLDAVIDQQRPYGKRQRRESAPDPIDILLVQQREQHRREQERRRRRGLDAAPPLAAPVHVPHDKPIPGLITPEQAKAESDARRAREAEKAAAALAKRQARETDRAARKELRRLKAVARAARNRAKKKEADNAPA